MSKKGVQMQWMEMPQAVAGCPSGLEYLQALDQVMVFQKIELCEIFSGCEMNNKYQICNNQGQQFLFAKEDTEFCMRYCCGSQRGFTINFLNNQDQEVMRVTREFKLCAGCPWCADKDCCAFEVTVEAPVGTVVGSVRQEKSCWSPKYSIRGADGAVVAWIEGPCCPISCGRDVVFPVLSSDGQTNIGQISKQWTGIFKEMFTDADTFNITFPQDMAVWMKAVMMGGMFLIDFMYFEQSNNDN